MGVHYVEFVSVDVEHLSTALPIWEWLLAFAFFVLLLQAITVGWAFVTLYDFHIVRTNDELREGSLEVFDRTFQVTAVLRLLAFIVAFVGVLSALMALELERSRELGVMRAWGLTPREVWKLVVAQTGLMGFVSGALAAPMGVALSVVMIYFINKRSFGWTLDMRVGPDVLLEALILALVGALLAGVYPAWRMSRTSPAVAMRGEGE